MGRAVVEVERQRGVYVRIVDGREAGDLDGSKVAVVCTPHADVAVARGGAAGIEGQCRDVGLCLGGRVQAVDVAAARIVDEVLLRGADEVAELVVSAPVSTATLKAKARARARARARAGWVAGCSRNRDAGRIVGLGGQHEGVRVSTPGAVAVSMVCSVEAAEAAYRKSSTAMFRGQVARRISLRSRSRSRSQAQELRCRASERYVTRGALKSWITVATSAGRRRTVV